MIVFDSDEVQVLYSDQGSDFVMVTFGTVAMRADGRSFFGGNVAERGKISALGFMPKGPNWFPEQYMVDAEKAIRPYLERFADRVSFGFSMGAYAAIKYSRLLNIDTTISMCPQYTINPRDVPAEFRQYEQHFREHLHANMKITAADTRGRIFVFYDHKLNVDNAHFQYIAKSVNLTGIRMPYTLHDTIRCFRGTKVISRLISLCRADDHAGICSYAIQQRKTDPIRAYALCQALMDRHPKWSAAIYEKYAREFPAGEFVLVTNGLADRASRRGDVGTAFDLFNESLARDPDNIFAQRGIVEVHRKRNALHEAVSALERLLDLEARDFGLHEMRASLLLAVGDIDRARHSVEASLELNPFHPGLLHWRSEIEQRAGRIPEALGWARRAMELDSGALFRRERVAQLLILNGDIDAAFDELQAMIATNPDYGGAYRLLVEVYSRRKQFDEAIVCHRKLIDLDPGNAVWRSWLVGTLLHINDLAAAREVAETALQHHPDNADLMHRLSEIEQKIGSLSRAIDWARHAVHIEPTSLFRHERLGFLLLEAGDRDGASEQFAACLALNPMHGGACRGLIEHHLLREEWADAIRWHKRLIEIDPENPAWRDWLVGTMQRSGDLSAAREAAEAALAKHPGHPDLLNRLSEIQQRGGMPADAIRSARQAAEADPSRPFRHERLGFLMLEAGDRDEAQRAFKRALEIDPNHAGAYRGMAEIHLQTDEIEEAIEPQRKLVELDPANPAWREWLIATLLRVDDLAAADAELRIALRQSPDHPGLLRRWDELVSRTNSVPPWMPDNTKQTVDRNWYDIHLRQSRIVRESKAAILFMGDSITEQWMSAGRVTWDQSFAPLGAANVGISGETTQGLIWRLDDGLLCDVAPRIVVLMIGTNNLPHSSRDDITRGVTTIVDRLTTALPDAKIVLMGLTPRGFHPAGFTRRKITWINSRLEEYARTPNLTYLDVGAGLLGPDGTFSPLVSTDGLHFLSDGYARIAPFLETAIIRLLAGAACVA